MDQPIYPKPIQDRIIVKPILADTTTASGILIANAGQVENQGIVMSVGDGRKLPNGTVVPNSVQEGDRVVYGNMRGQRIKLNDTECLVMRDSDIIAVMGGRMSENIPSIVSHPYAKELAGLFLREPVEMGRFEVKQSAWVWEPVFLSIHGDLFQSRNSYLIGQLQVKPFDGVIYALRFPTLKEEVNNEPTA